MHKWLVFIHVAATLGFMLTHGVSTSVSFALRRTQNIEQIRTLLELSANSYRAMYLSLLTLLLSGIIAGFTGHWWRTGWIWASLLALIAMIVAMAILGGGIYSETRRLAGLPYTVKGQAMPPLPPASTEEVKAKLATANPHLLTLIGYGGILLILWLMMFKPF